MRVRLPGDPRLAGTSCRAHPPSSLAKFSIGTVLHQPTISWPAGGASRSSPQMRGQIDSVRASAETVLTKIHNRRRDPDASRRSHN
jgi:hypothetical protein